MKKIVDLSANSAELKPVINEVANQIAESENTNLETLYYNICLLYTSDAADECVNV